MELLTKQIIRKFEEHPIYSQDGKGLKAEVLSIPWEPERGSLRRRRNRRTEIGNSSGSATFASGNGVT